MKILITGACGFVGRFLRDELVAHGHEVVAHDRTQDADVQFDIADVEGVAEGVAKLNVDACIHLAGIAFVPRGWTEPKTMFDVNVGGTINMLEAFREFAPHARLLAVTSSQIYGNEPRPEPIREEDKCEPDNIYAVAKLAADYTTLLYHVRHGQFTMTARPANHIGPGQSPDFVLPSFVRQLHEIAAGKREPKMLVGNLDSIREFTDVRDVARAYRLLIENGKPGQAYNIASGRFVTIRWILGKLCEFAGVQPEIVVDPKLFRPTDEQPHIDFTRIQRDTGWCPEIPLEQSLADIYARG
jgi:GDP-4-dehydro-6-deoxy-D-mannose reductase